MSTLQTFSVVTDSIVLFDLYEYKLIFNIGIYWALNAIKAWNRYSESREMDHEICIRINQRLVLQAN